LSFGFRLVDIDWHKCSENPARLQDTKKTTDYSDIFLMASAFLIVHELHPNFTNWHPPTNNRASHGKLKENYYKNFNLKFVLIFRPLGRLNSSRRFPTSMDHIINV